MSKALLKYYYDVTRYNIAFSILIGVLRGVTPAIISVGTFGMFIGVICFGYLQSNQYYFYYNLGFTKLRLISTAWGINLMLAALILLIASYVYAKGSQVTEQAQPHPQLTRNEDVVVHYFELQAVSLA